MILPGEWHRIALWNAANAASRAAYHADRALADGLCRTCQDRPRYRDNALCAPCLYLMRAVRGTT